MSFRIGDLLTMLVLSALAWGMVTEDGFAQVKRKKLMLSASGANAEKPKFVELLDSKDFSHFRGYNSEEIPEGWEVKQKVLSFNGKGSGDVITKETYKDFELQVEWSIEKGGNSGIMFRVTLGDDQPYYSGPEFQILDDESAGDGKNELTSAGALYDLYPATEKELKPAGTWNKSRIIVEGNQITHYLNGKKVVEVESGSDDWNERLAKSKFKDWEKFNKAETGHIAFQNHGNAVKFRKLRIKRMGLETDGNDTEGEASADAAAAGDAAGDAAGETEGQAKGERIR